MDELVQFEENFSKLCIELSNKKILVWGLGREGLSSLHFLQKHTIKNEIYVCDSNKNLAKDTANKLNINFIHQNKEKSFYNYDIILKSPGIRYNANLKNLNICSQVFFLLKYFSKNTIAVTGTKGKSTVSTLIKNILKYKYQENVYLLGNIGDPIFNVFNNTFKVSPIFIVELSSYQLENVEYSPKIAVFLNLYKDHIDYHKNFENYKRAKENIFKWQKKDDTLILSKQENNKINLSNVQSKLVYIDKKNTRFEIANNNFYFENKFIFSFNNFDYLNNEHNKKNFLFALNVCLLFHVNSIHILNAIKNFRGLEHRLEKIISRDEIIYYNDSISTVPESTIAAVKAVGKINYLILGGFDRGIDFAKLYNFLQKLSNLTIITMGPAGLRIYKHIVQQKNIQKKLCIHYFDSLENGVKLVKTLSVAKQICVFSPSAASHNEFNNFIERGLSFKKYLNSD